MTSRSASRSPSARSLARAVVVSLGALLPAVARAKALPVELTWQAPEECPSRADVLARVRELVGAAGEGAPLVRAEGAITKVANGFELRLQTEQEGQRGERLVRSAKCDDLRGVAAVALTLLLTAGKSTDAGTDAGTPAPSAPAAPATPPSAPSAPDLVQPEPDPSGGASRHGSSGTWRLLVPAPQLALQFGPLPKPSPAPSVGVGVEGSWWSVRALGQWGPEQRVAASQAGYGALVQRAVVGIWACTELRFQALSVAPCAVGSAARLRVSGYGASLVPRSQSEVTWSAGVGVVGRARVTPWLAMMVAVSGQAELNRPELWIDTEPGLRLATIGQVRRLAPVSGVLLVGPEWIF